MLVKQIPVNNSLRNYMYLIACPETREAAAIDPLDHQLCLQSAHNEGWQIRSVINTHEHYDHTGGNEEVIAATGATLYAHHNATDKIANVDVGLTAGDAVQIGTTVRLLAMDTPGHTFCHTCLLYEGDDQQLPALFCGDTLFNAGVGNCHNGGNPETMYQTFAEQIFVLADITRIYPGHDYIVNNLQFTLAREPDNQAAMSLLAAMQQWQSDKHFISNIAMERAVNAFFRLDSETVIRLLREQFPELPTQPDQEQVFLKLRELRNSW
ncbi:MAG: hydroxyacylglutathione hydrolase [Gammaproteobacteria bacterium]|nr:hydroxyacylglutathione hydrolase [Gammaproteobacteria bacterium]